ncbi:MAG: carbon-nitrogen hydrolase family protein [Granulosicoccaceae bacterium]
MTTIQVATANYPITRHASWDAYCQHIEAWATDAAEQGAQLLVFPEYGAMELSSLLDVQLQADLHGQIGALQTYLEPFIALHQRLAQQLQVTLLAASLPVLNNQAFVNRAYLALPNGTLAYQDKLTMTRFEHEHWNIKASDELSVFNTPVGKLGVCICYDSEFPHYARQLVERGADIILVPSCTDTLAGYNRVRIGSRARALENQCYVIQSPTVGNAAWAPAVDENHGAAAVYTPVDKGFPDDGVLAQAHLNKPCWLYCTLDLSLLANVRRDGQVLNHRDWTRQFRDLTLKTL